MTLWINLAVLMASLALSCWLVEKIDLWIHRRDLRDGTWSRYSQDLF